MNKTLKTALGSLILNIAFCAYYFILGTMTKSWWLITLGTYYFILCATRFVVLRAKEMKRFVTKFTGWMLILLTLPLIGTVVLSIIKDRGHAFHMIAMIAIATYSFVKIVFAIVNFMKSRRGASAAFVTLRNISLADGFVSIFALQRSMLVSFPGMSGSEVQIMNAAVGSAVCVVVFLLGINLVKSM